MFAWHAYKHGMPTNIHTYVTRLYGTRTSRGWYKLSDSRTQLNFDIDTRDWQGDYNYSQTTYTNILSQHSPASSSWISIAHDIHTQTVHGFAQYMIDQARKYNYQLVTVGECLGDPPANWYRDPSTGQPYGAAAASGGARQGQAQAFPLSSSSSAAATAPSSPTSAVIRPQAVSTAASTTPVPSPRLGTGVGGAKNGTSTSALSSSTPTANAAPAAAAQSTTGLLFCFLALVSCFA